MHLNSLMELTAKDPDPYFFGSYNWYYTGGVLETASIVDVDFLFYVSGEKLNVFSELMFFFNVFAYVPGDGVSRVQTIPLQDPSKNEITFLRTHFQLKRFKSPAIIS